MKKYALVTILIFMCVFCFSQVFTNWTPGCTSGDIILQLVDAKRDYSVSENETEKIVTAKNIDIYSPDLPVNVDSIYGDVSVFFKSDNLYKVEVKSHDADLYQEIKKQFENEYAREKVEIETGSCFILSEDGIIYKLTESGEDYIIECEFNTSLIPTMFPWYMIKLHPEEYKNRNLILDEVIIYFDDYKSSFADWEGADYESIILFETKTDGDFHMTIRTSQGRQFLFCMYPETGEEYLSMAYKNKSRSIVAKNVKCGLIKDRGDNDNWYVVMFDIGDADIQ